MTSSTQTQAVKAKILRDLHHGSRAVIFPNVWDVTGARVIEDAGFPAIATTSAGIANSLGYPDSQNISRDQMLEVVRRIATSVRVPVTADMEAGYSNTPTGLYDTAKALIASGAVGLNLEDSLDDESHLIDLPLQLDKIRALKQAGEELNVPLVVNARTDAYWWKGAKPETKMKETIARTQAFRSVGADCVFIPGLRDLEEIKLILRESPGPLNVLAVPGWPSIPELEAAGVRRISIGSGGYRAAIGLLRILAQHLREQGTYELIKDNAIPFAEVNDLLRRE